MKEIKIPDWRGVELDVPDKWNRYIGTIWANIFLKCKLPKNGTVIEIAPGITNKISYGLSFVGFKGTIYVIEPEEYCLNCIVKNYRKKLKGCKIIPIQKTMEEAISILPKKVDAIIANHPLDDMILGNFLKSKSKKFVDYFGKKFGGDADRTRFLWNRLLKDKKLLEKIKIRLVLDWERLIKKTHPNFVVISQYISYYFRKNGIIAPDDNGLDVLMRIRKRYAKFDNRKIINSIEAYNADMMHWIIMILEKPK
ncbi:hypothetical protein HZA33_04755 [Candidatus Pacearchaeota archaeon]|nr:hypothetical protein [Candidatus Pacearchaeota archaeon]